MEIPETHNVVSTNGGWLTSWLALVLIAVAVAGWYGYKHYLRAPADQSATIVSAIGASSCTSSGYEITNKIAGTKTPLYDCVMPSGNEKCVTWENGLANDQTATAKLLFQNVLSGTPPTCAT